MELIKCMKFNTISIFNRFLQKSHVFPKKNMTHDFPWVMKIVRCSRFDLFLWNAKKIRLLSINMTPSGWSVWFFPLFAFFSKTTIFWYRNILYDSSLFSKFHLVLEGQKKSREKGNFENNFSLCNYLFQRIWVCNFCI